MTQMTGVPWILAKGNHDITGPGAVEAFDKYYIPAIRRQTGNAAITQCKLLMEDGRYTIYMFRSLG